MHLESLPNLTIPILLALPLLSFGQSSDYQFKNIVLGVVIEADTVPVLNVDKVDKDFIEMVNSTINDVANLSSLSRVQDVFGNENLTRTSEITVVLLDYNGGEIDMEAVPEISVLLTLLGCEETHLYNKKVTDAYGPTVHIAITDPGCPRLDKGSALTLPLTWFRRNADLLQLLHDMRSENVLPRWKEAIVIFDRQAGDEILDTVAEGLGSNLIYPDIALTIYQLDSMSLTKSFSDQIEGVMQKYTKTSAGNFILVTKSGNVNRVLEVARTAQFLSIMKQWVFIVPDPTGNEFSWDYVTNRIIADGVNVAFVMNSSSNATDTSNQLFCHAKELILLLSDTVETLATTEFETYLQVSNEEWDIIKPTRLDRVVNITQSMTQLLDERVLSNCDKNSSTWNFRAAENGKTGKQVFETGWFNPLTGVRMTDDFLPHVTGGFRGRRIDVASMHLPPWQLIIRSDEDDSSNVTYSGLLFEVLDHMAKDLNFTYNVLEPRPGETYGSLQQDGSWTGMMKMVAENKVVIAAAAFTVTAERSQYVDFTEVLEREAYGFMVNRPQELSRVLLFAAPFSLEVWLCIIATVIVVAPILNIVHCMSYYYKFYKQETEKGLFKLKNCYWYIYGSLLQQGGIHLPEAISGRVLIGFWWLFVIVTVTTYSGNLVAFLTFPKVESPVNTVDDIIHYKGVDSWGFLAGSVIEDHLKRSPDPKFEVLYKKAIRHPALNRTVLDKVTYQQHAYIDWKITLLTVTRDELKSSGRCEYLLGAETFFEEKIALAVPKGSPYLPIFNKQISLMLQTGLIKKWKSRFWPQKDKCSQLTIGAAGNRKVGIGDMQGSFYLLLMGFLIALSVLVVELIIYRRRKQRLINTIQIIVASNQSTQFWQQKQFPYLQ